MKKVKMVVTSVVVLATVGSAFALKNKKAGAFCLSSVANMQCFESKGIKIVTSGGISMFYQRNWDGDSAHCSGSNNCSTLAQFNND